MDMPTPPMPNRTPSPGPTGPASVNVKNEGMEMNGAVLASLGIKVFVKALENLGATTPKGQAVLKALNIVTKEFGMSGSSDLEKAELKLLQTRAPEMPKGPGAAQSSVQQKMQSLGMSRPAPAPAMAQAS